MVNITFNLNNFEYFLLILVRITAFMYVAPIFSTKGVPNQVKIGLSVFCSILLYNVLDKPELVYTDVIGYAVIVLSEGITGLLIGFSASVCSSIVIYAGNLIDVDIGLSMASQFNSEMNYETTVSGDLYYYAVMLMLLSSNMHSYVLRAACDSFQVIPIGNPNFQLNALLNSMITYMTDFFVIGFRIFLPVFACIMILNCILGIMAKVAPQMNMFSVGMQMKVLVGLCIIYITVFMMPNVADFIFSEVKKMVVMVIEGMY